MVQFKGALIENGLIGRQKYHARLDISDVMRNLRTQVEAVAP